jgi:nucleotide-binding universal stress UspA family protein
MKPYSLRHILVPTDFSSIAANALQHAVTLAKLTNAKITLVHVVEPSMNAVGTSGMIHASSRIEEQLRRRTTRRLVRLARGMMRRSKVSVEVLSLAGRVAPMLLKAMSQTRCDLVIMGTHGATGFVENLLGSNTYRIASLSKVPLLSVHKKMSPRGYSRVVYPIREESHASDKFPQALTFARMFHARVSILGLLPEEGKTAGRRTRARCVAVQRRFQRHQVRASISLIDKGFFPDAAVRHAHTHPGSLIVIVQDADFHLVELFQGSFTKRVLHTVLSPVLAVPSR